jgi:hypothetical protein
MPGMRVLQYNSGGLREKTALSDPGLLDDYGNPKIGKFYPPRIAEAKAIARRR